MTRAKSFTIAVSNLSGWPDPGPAVAAARAGAAGILNLEHLGSVKVAADLTARAVKLARRAKGELGVRIAASECLLRETRLDERRGRDGIEHAIDRAPKAGRNASWKRTRRRGARTQCVGGELNRSEGENDSADDCAYNDPNERVPARQRGDLCLRT